MSDNLENVLKIIIFAGMWNAYKYHTYDVRDQF